VFNRREKHGIDAQLHPGDLLIVDEAHIQKGSEAQKIINEYASMHEAFVVGISATPLGIGGIYTDGLIVAGNNAQLRDCGALVWANRYEPAIMDLGKIYKKKTGVISQSAADTAARSIWTQVVVANILGSWKKLNPDARPSIGMAPGVKESRGLAQEYWSHGINAAHIDSGGIYVNGSYKTTTEQTDRDELFAMLKDGTVNSLHQSPV
jgi:superfamily II DNA or RNA helicase